MRILRLALLAAVLPGLPSCDGPTAPDGDVRVWATEGFVAVANEAPIEKLYTFVIPERALPLVDWIPCVEDACGMVPPGEAVVRQAGELGAEPGEIVVVHSWRRAYTRGLAPVPGPVTQRRVRLSTLFVP